MFTHLSVPKVYFPSRYPLFIHSTIPHFTLSLSLSLSLVLAVISYIHQFRCLPLFLLPGGYHPKVFLDSLSSFFARHHSNSTA